MAFVTHGAAQKLQQNVTDSASKQQQQQRVKHLLEMPKSKSPVQGQRSPNQSHSIVNNTVSAGKQQLKQSATGQNVSQNKSSQNNQANPSRNDAFSASTMGHHRPSMTAVNVPIATGVEVGKSPYKIVGGML